MRPPILIVLVAIAGTVYVLGASATFMWTVRVRIRRARRLALAGHHREAERVIDIVAADCTAFRAAHPEWVRV